VDKQRGIVVPSYNRVEKVRLNFVVLFCATLCAFTIAPTSRAALAADEITCQLYRQNFAKASTESQRQLFSRQISARCGRGRSISAASRANAVPKVGAAPVQRVGAGLTTVPPRFPPLDKSKPSKAKADVAPNVGRALQPTASRRNKMVRGNERRITSARKKVTSLPTVSRQRSRGQTDRRRCCDLQQQDTLEQTVWVSGSDTGTTSLMDAALARVAEGGTIYVKPGTYRAPPHIYKRVRIESYVLVGETRPTLNGRMRFTTSGSTIRNFDLRAAVGRQIPEVVEIPSGISASLQYVTIQDYECRQDLRRVAGLVTVDGTAQFDNLAIFSGYCYAIALNGGVVTTKNGNWTSLARFVIVQNGGILDIKSSSFSVSPLPNSFLTNSFRSAQTSLSGVDLLFPHSGFWGYSQDYTATIITDTVTIRRN
jgi:hypothetical protein